MVYPVLFGAEGWWSFHDPRKTMANEAQSNRTRIIYVANFPIM